MNNQTKWFTKEPFGAFWEKGYRDKSVSCMGGPSFEVAEILQALPKKAKVLDLGCGEGRNAFYLARHGCEVTAVDRSAAGINKLQTLAEQYQVTLKCIVQDIQEFALTDEYDLIMAHGVLYYLENADWRKLLTQVKEQTRVGGFNIFTLFVYNERYPCVEEIESAQYKNSFRPKEIKEFYSDWIEHRFDQYVKWDSHPGIPLHYHPIEKLVSQKPLKKLIKTPINTGKDLNEQSFHEVDMGITIEVLQNKIGKPHAIESMHMDGIQFGISNDNLTTNGYGLELWYYGRFVIYVVNGVVTGRAIYETQPVRLDVV